MPQTLVAEYWNIERALTFQAGSIPKSAQTRIVEPRVGEIELAELGQPFQIC